MTRGPKLAIVLAGVLVAFIAGSGLRQLSGLEAAGIGAAIGLPTVIALFGMFWVAEKWQDAITAAVLVAYIIILSGVIALTYLTGEPRPLTGGAADLLTGFTYLVGLVMLSFFGDKSIEKWADAYRDGKRAAAHKPKGPPTRRGRRRRRPEASQRRGRGRGGRGRRNAGASDARGKEVSPAPRQPRGAANPLQGPPVTAQ